MPPLLTASKESSPRAATPEQLAAIRIGCLEKGIDIDIILEDQRVSQLEELDYGSAQKVQEWIENQ